MASDMDRRSFLKIGAVGATGLAQGIPLLLSRQQKSLVIRTRAFGNTLNWAKPDCAYRISRLARVR